MMKKLQKRLTMSHVGELKRRQDHWPVDTWMTNLIRLRHDIRLYAKSAFALAVAHFFTGSEMRKLEKRLVGYQRLGEDVVLAHTGKWFALLERMGLRQTCLIRSLALARVLRQEGYDAHLVFGVRSENGEMEGHCWVSIGGRAVTEAPASFKELYDE
jgi:hypothetical protein